VDKEKKKELPKTLNRLGINQKLLNMKKILMPTLIIVMGAGAAFASNIASKRATVVPTYRIDAISGQCIQVEQECDNEGSFVCTWNEDDMSVLHELKVNETTCSQTLTRTNP